MKKQIIRLAAILVMIATTLSLCACEPTFERLQRKLGISFDNIICQYSTWITDSDPLWTSWEEKKEITSTNITFYADNTVVIWTSKVAYDTEVGGQAVLGRQLGLSTPWLTERHGYDPTLGRKEGNNQH